jgi:hypothetical protein
VTYPDFYGSICTYDFNYGAADGVGSHMSAADDSFHAGWRCGFAIGQIWAGEEPERIMPETASRLGARTIKINYGGGYTAPLSFSTAVVSDPGNFGYEVGTYNASGVFEPLTISSVSIAGGEAVVIRMAADLPAVNIAVRYAHIGGVLDDADPDPFGSFAGRLTGARGCLQAATGRTFSFNGGTVTEVLRPAIHAIQV